MIRGILNLTRKCLPAFSNEAKKNLHSIQNMPEMILAKMRNTGDKSILYVDMNHCGAAIIKKNGINTVIRNEYWTLMRGTGIDAFVEKLDAEVVTYAPDPAHLHIAGADYLAYYEKYAKQAKAVCFTDTKFVDELDVYKTISPEYPQDGRIQRVYYDLGFGEMDFNKIYAILKENGFDGPVLLDSKYSIDIPKGILRMRTFWNNLEKNYAKEVK